MLTKTTMITLSAALILGTACAALAAPETDQKGGFRELGPGGVVKQGVNPVYHRSMHKAGGNAAACKKYFSTYEPATGTYVGADSQRHQC